VYVSDSADDEKYWRFDAVFSDIDIRNCSTRCLRTQGESAGQNSLIAGLTFKGIRGNGSDISFAGLREAVISDVYNRTGDIQFYGQETALSGAMSTLPRHHVVIDNVSCDGGTISFQDLRGVSVGTVRSVNADTSGVLLTRVHSATFGSINVVLANRGNTGTVRALLLSKVQHVYIADLEIEHDANTTTTWSSIELGGGDATDRSNNIVIDNAVYRNTINATDSDVTIQGGGNAPFDYIYRMRHYNGGEASPIWRNEEWGSTTWTDRFTYTGSPEGGITAKIGSTYQRIDGGEDTAFYVKESGTGATGWTAIPDA
jgi:hypothetical protein